jgi:hypothetical protein
VVVERATVRADARRPVYVSQRVAISVLAAVVAWLLGTLVATSAVHVTLGLVMTLVAALLLRTVSSAWMVILVGTFPFSDYVADKLSLPNAFITPARLLVAFITVYAILRYLARGGTSAAAATSASRAHFPVLVVALLLAIWVLLSGLSGSSKLTGAALFAIRVILLPSLAFWSLSVIPRRPAGTKIFVLFATAVLTVEVVWGTYEYITHEGILTTSVTEGPQTSFGISPGAIIGVRADGSFTRSEEYSIFCGSVSLILIAYWLTRGRRRTALVPLAFGVSGAFVSGLRGVLLPLVLISAWLFLRDEGRIWSR